MFLGRSSASSSITLGASTGDGFSTIVSQGLDNGSSNLGVNSFQRQAQTFTTNNAYSQIRVSAPFFQRAGTVGGTYRFYIFNTTSSVPSGSALFTSSVLNYLDLPSSDPTPARPTQYLATGLSLSDATTYAIAWYHISGTGSDGFSMPVQGGGSVYPGGNQAFDFSGGGSWTAAFTNDINLLIEGKP